MQVTETLSDNLRREYKVVVSADALEERTTARLGELKSQVKLPGFRPGKIPDSLMRKRFGQNVLGEVLEKAVQDAVKEVVDSNELRPALQPGVDISSYEEGKDLEIELKIEIMPDIGSPDFSKLSFEKEVAPVAEESITEGLSNLAARNKTTKELEEARAAVNGDTLVMDFLGKVDGEAFEGGAAEDYQLELGSGSFIPGFEEQLVGANADSDVTVTVTFPEDYPAETLKGKEAVFECKIKKILETVLPEIDDDLAKNFGKETLDELRQALEDDLKDRYEELSKNRMKRRILDVLADEFTFDVPEGLVTQEFDGIWKQIEEAKENDQLDPSDKDKSDEELTEEYKGIALRRVRLGLLLAEVGRMNEITVTEEDVGKAVMQEARRYPGQEMAVFNYYKSNREALESLRAPVFEEKVIDYIVELAEVTEKEIPLEELMKDPDGDDHDHDHDHDHA